MKKKRSRLSTIMALIMVTALLIGVLPSGAYAVTRSEIDALKEKRDEIAEQKAAQQAIVDELETQHASVLERKLALDERNEYTREQIQLNREEIELYAQMIAEKAQEVEDARTLEEEQLERYRTRVRAMEENGSYDFLALLLNTTSLGAFLTTIDDIGEIMANDRQLEEDYIAAREETERVKAEYEQTRTELEAKQEALRAEAVELQNQIDEATELINQLLTDIEGNEAEIEELNRQQDSVQREIDELVAELERQRAEEEERRRQEELAKQSQNTGGSTSGGSSGGTVTGTGSFGWPVPSCTYVTSRAGNRFHPIFNEWRYHSGMDIGASYGAAIVASDGGTVCWCDVKGGYGNCIMIDHGNGYYTLYGHMSSYAVSYGDTVSKGQTIGYVGSTGWATGPHLHFEIRCGDTIIEDIEGFCGFTGLTYAPDAGE